VEAYRVQIRVRSKNLRVGRGPLADVRRTTYETQYLIGSADDAFLCCRHGDIKPHHCWIVVHQQGVQARSADASIRVNDVLVDERVELESGDVVSVGPLELEVYFHSTAEERRALAEASTDPVEEKISDWLIHKDEEERQTRLRDSKVRNYKFDQAEMEKQPEQESKASAKGASRPAPPQRKKPGKLPQRPSTPTSKSSDAAAEGALKQIFTRWGEKKGEEPEKK